MIRIITTVSLVLILCCFAIVYYDRHNKYMEKCINSDSLTDGELIEIAKRAYDRSNIQDHEANNLYKHNVKRTIQPTPIGEKIIQTYGWYVSKNKINSDDPYGRSVSFLYGTDNKVTTSIQCFVECGEVQENCLLGG